MTDSKNISLKFLFGFYLGQQQLMHKISKLNLPSEILSLLIDLNKWLNEIIYPNNALFNILKS